MKGDLYSQSQNDPGKFSLWQKFLKRSATALLATVFCLSPIAGQSAEKKRTETNIIVFDLRGGQTPRLNEEPLLVIKTDHTLILGAPYGKRKRIETRIEEKRLQALLNHILDQQQFLQLDTKQIQQTIDNKLVQQQKKGKFSIRLGFSTQLADASTSFFSVTTDGQEHHKSYYALRHSANKHPEIPSLQQLYAIQQRLMHEMNMAAIGGEKEKNKYLQLLNAKVFAKHPEAPSLNSNNLELAFVRADGTLWMQWRNIWKSADGRQRGMDGFITVKENRQAQIKLNFW